MHIHFLTIFNFYVKFISKLNTINEVYMNKKMILKAILLMMLITSFSGCQFGKPEQKNDNRQNAQISVFPELVNNKLFYENLSDQILSRPKFTEDGNYVIVKTNTGGEIKLPSGIKIDQKIQSLNEGISKVNNNGETQYLLNGKVIYSGNEFWDMIMSPNSNKAALNKDTINGNKILIKDLSNDQNEMDLGNGYFPNWINDSFIVFEISRSKQDGHKLIINNSDLWLANADTGEKIKITKTTEINEVEPSISPDSKFLIYRDANNSNLYIAEIITTQGDN